MVYEGPATLDANNAVDWNVVVSAPYVIVRGLTLKGAKRDGIRLLAPAHHVVIEDNDISNWGRWDGTTTPTAGRCRSTATPRSRRTAGAATAGSRTP